MTVFAKFGVKMLFCQQYFSPLNTLKKGKDPDPDQYPWIVDPDPQHCNN